VRFARCRCRFVSAGRMQGHSYESSCSSLAAAAAVLGPSSVSYRLNHQKQDTKIAKTSDPPSSAARRLDPSQLASLPLASILDPLSKHTHTHTHTHTTVPHTQGLALLPLCNPTLIAAVYSLPLLQRGDPFQTLKNTSPRQPNSDTMCVYIWAQAHGGIPQQREC